jgi:hypothetical protein
MRRRSSARVVRGIANITANSRTPKPSGGHSIASDRSSNASGGVRVAAADGLRDVARASGAGRAVVEPRRD